MDQTKHTQPANDRRRPGRRVVLVAAAVAFALLGDQALYAVLPVCFEELGLTPFQVGVLLSANRWIRLFTNQVAERLTRRFDARWLMLGVLILGSFLTVAYGTCCLFSVLLTARLLWGLCWSVMRQIGVMTAIESATTGDLGRAIGLYNGVTRLGSVTGHFVGALLYDVIGFSATFLIFGAISLLAAPLGTAARKRPEPERLPGANSDGRRRGSALIALLFCGFVAGCVGPGLVTSTLGFVLKARVGGSISMAGLAVGVATLNGLVLASRNVINSLGAPVLGGLLDRIGHRRGACGFCGGAALVLLAASAASHTAALVSLIMIFFVCATSVLVVFGAAAGGGGSRTYAWYATAVDLGAAIGPLAGWTMVEFGHSPTKAFAVGGGLYALAALASFVAVQTATDSNGAGDA